MNLPARMLARPSALVLLLAAATGSLALPTRDQDITSHGVRVRRVSGGHKVDITLVPYQARIELPNGTCGGTIIHPSYVLTAKHCVKERSGLAQAFVAAGAPNAGGRPEVRRQVRRAVPFPTQREERARWLPADVDPDLVMGDIALLQVYPPFPTDRVSEIRPVGLQKRRSFVGTSCVISGWGTTRVNEDPAAPSLLRAALVEVFPESKCRDMEKRLKKDFICAGRSGGGVDACDGDSGGPLLCEGKLTGVVKGGRGCGESRHVTKYTEVALYARWVASVVDIDERRLGSAWAAA